MTCAPIEKKNNPMNTSIKRDITTFLIAAMYLGGLVSAHGAQSCPGSMRAGGMDCTLEEASVDDKGVLHCTYSCTPTPAKPAKAELDSLGARARAAVTGLNVKDPASIKRVNAELKKVHADLAAFAKAHNLKLIKKEYTHPPTSKTAR